jgi:CPA1 family monovalent cation:H+ antiporter
MLAFLLFAGALNLDLHQLSREKLPVFVLSVLGTVISTGIIAALIKLILYAVGLSGDTIGCLLFGALISPTDPIAVLEMLRRVGVPASLETQLAGESLFNDGVGAVLFLSLVEASQRGGLPPLGRFLFLLVVKAGGGIAIGLLLGYLVYRMLLLVESYRVEVLLTIALAMGGYALADVLGLSAPLEAVAAGLLAGGRARTLAMSPLTRDHVDKFWELADDILNVVLFLLMGLELLVLPWSHRYIYAGLLAIPAVLLARFASVGACYGLLRIVQRPARGTIAILTWGGLRGGLAIALALSIPLGPQRNQLLVITYVVVVFAIVVQGLTMGRLLRRFQATEPARTV